MGSTPARNSHFGSPAKHHALTCLHHASKGSRFRVVALLASLGVGAVTTFSTQAHAQQYRFPAKEEQLQLFYPTAYKDHAGVDWNCGDVRYDNHQGSDFGVGGFEGMDEGRDIVAAAPGIVVETHDGEFDRCTTGDCDGGGVYGNHVIVRHPDGKSTLYAHMKSGTVAVSVGQFVECGEFLGQVGSSGWSTGPHLHFGVKYLDGNFHDPFDGPCSNPPSYWVDQGIYLQLPATVCDTTTPCVPVEQKLSCGAVINASNDSPGATSWHGYYGCGDYVYSASEIAYEFATNIDEPVTLSLTGLSGDLSLQILDSSLCSTSDCLGQSDQSATSDETITFNAQAGHIYTVVIDGYEGAVCNFTLSATCSGQWPVGTGGTSTGGTSGSGGSGQGATGQGATGQGGSSGESGTAGSVAGSAGNTAGSAGSVAGTGQGGSDSSQAGHSGDSANAGQSGESGTGGTTIAATPAEDTSGCDCTVSGKPSRTEHVNLVWAAVSVLVLVQIRRRKGETPLYRLPIPFCLLRRHHDQPTHQ